MERTAEEGLGASLLHPPGALALKYGPVRTEPADLSAWRMKNSIFHANKSVQADLYMCSPLVPFRDL